MHIYKALDYIELDIFDIIICLMGVTPFIVFSVFLIKSIIGGM
jgi:hypothetical protein